MTTATRPRQTIGERLAAKAPKPRRKPSTRPRRNAADAAEARRLRRDRDAEVKTILKDVRRLNAERGLEQSHVGRELLRLTDRRSKALFREQFASLALTTTRQDAELCRAEHSRVCNQLRYGEYEKAHRALWEAEALERKASQLHSQAVHARELCDAELRLLAQAGSR